MRHPTRLLPLALLIGCAPHQADIAGSYTTWLAAGSSATVDENDLSLAEAGRFNCSGVDVVGFDTECGADLDPEWSTWLDDDAYYVLKGDLEAWRSEAIITSEQDLQVTFHVHLTDREDFRVAWVIDPDFQPTRCEQDESGNATLELWDDDSWIERWSDDEQGFIYYLNTGSYQLNPYDSEDYWELHDDWLSGFGKAKFAAEEFNSRPSDFGMYEAGTTESFFVSLDPDEPDWDSYDAMVASVQESALAWQAELAGDAGGETAADVLGFAHPDFQIKVEDNSWRPVDISSAGLDGWVQVDSSWVIFDDDPKDIAVGDSASGSFQIEFKGFESGSRTVVTGTFDIPQVFEDRWGYEDLYTEKQAENETPTCE